MLCRHQRLTYSQLMDTTLLPTNELSEALHLLTSEPHPVLCSAHSHKHTLTSDTPLLPNTAFQVNEHFVSQLHVGSGQLVTCCHGNDSRRGWKANASSYSTHLFEQRRAIIDSAVARTMKRERTLSVDSVAGKVSTHTPLYMTNLVPEQCKHCTFVWHRLADYGHVLLVHFYAMFLYEYALLHTLDCWY